MIVTIDGPSGAGKSTVANQLAKRLGFRHIDSGAIYRALTLLALKHNRDIEGEDLSDFFRGLDIRYEFLDDGSFRLLVNGEDVSDAIRSDEVSNKVSIVAKKKEYRDIVNDILRRLVVGGDFVLDGRDMGSEVFPNAEVKFYLTASLEERARRRYEDYKMMGIEKDMEDVKKELEERDEKDMNREYGALKKADDSFYIDTTNKKIKEVVEEMETKIKERLQKEEESDADEYFQQLLEEKREPIMEDIEGIKKGKVVHIDDSVVYLDVGYKTEAVVEKLEFDRRIPEIGDELNVYLTGRKTQEGLYIASYKKARAISSLHKIAMYYKENKYIDGRVEKLTGRKKGFIVDIDGITAYLPISELSANLRKRIDDVIGRKLRFKILSFEPKKRKIILSHREYLREIREKRLDELFSRLKVGDIIKGKVVAVKNFGAFVDVNGVEAFLPVEEISWSRVIDIKEHIKEGEVLEFVVLSLDRDKERIILGRKQLKENPWEKIREKYKEGDIVEGVVKSLASFGAFVELENDIEGLIHISEFSWTKKIKHPKEMLSVGDKVRVKVLSIDPKNKRISLGLKQLKPNPWDTVKEDFPQGKIVEVEVIKKIDGGILVETENELIGYISNRDLTWRRRYKPVRSKIKVGNRLKVMVIGIDEENKRIIFSLKHLQPKPIEQFMERYKVGDVINGKIMRVLKAGLVVKVSYDIEAFIPANQVSSKRIDDITEHFSRDDEINAVIIRIDKENSRVILSIKDYEKLMEEEEIKKYLKEPTTETTVKLGEFLKLSLEKKK